MAVAFSMAWLAQAIEQQGPGAADTEAAEAAGLLAGFHRRLHGCFTARADALFELADAVLCTDGPVRTLVELALAPEHRRGHGALYDAVNRGGIVPLPLNWTHSLAKLCNIQFNE